MKHLHQIFDPRFRKRLAFNASSFVSACLLGCSLSLSAVAQHAPDRATAARVLHLFDGESLDGWQKFGGQPLGPGWDIDDGAIHRVADRSIRAGHIYWTARQFTDFELSWKWKIAPGGNSGLKYRVKQYGNRWLGCEYQLLDDQRHHNARDPKRSAGALYNLYAPGAEKRLKPVGEFNESRVVVMGSRIEHWLNGEKILECDTASDDWRERVQGSKFNEYAAFGQNTSGYIMLQDHGSEVWFRDIAIRDLPHLGQ